MMKKKIQIVLNTGRVVICHGLEVMGKWLTEFYILRIGKPPDIVSKEARQTLQLFLSCSLKSFKHRYFFLLRRQYTVISWQVKLNL